MALLLKGARVIDPANNIDEVCEILVRDGEIVEIGHHLKMEKGAERDLAGKILVPGLIDIHVHLRDPGYEYKEDIASGSRAAAKGGFTSICCMPNTLPVIDTGALVEYVKSAAKASARCRIEVAGACTKGEEGSALSEMGDMVAHGAVAFTDDGRGVQDAGTMRRVLEYSKSFKAPVMSHCQDENLVGKGQINEGPVSTRLGLAGWPAAGEEIQIARDIELCALTGCPLHIQHISTERGLQLVREAKDKGLPVTCEVTPHHLFLSDEDIDETYNTNLKVNPPLRSKSDNLALIEGLKNGTIDCIVTDHAPHAAHEKAREFELAPFGMVGLETSLGLIVSKLVDPGLISWQRLVELMSINPRRILGIKPVEIKPKAIADFTVIDPELSWVVKAEDFASKSANSGFLGWSLKGKAWETYVGGYATLEEGALTDYEINL